jgi:nucleotide-binding universal stress UspA family protein
MEDGRCKLGLAGRLELVRLIEGGASMRQAAAAHEASVIVLGTRGLSGLSAVLGSVSQGVLHHAKQAVLVVP